MQAARDVEFVFEPDLDGGYHAHAPELPGLHTQGRLRIKSRRQVARLQGTGRAAATPLINPRG
jgi:hypothetical protein